MLVFLPQNIEMDVIMRSTWKEDRLEYTETPEQGRNYAVDAIDASKFWKPQFLIAGMTGMSSRHGQIDLSFIMVSEGKRILYVFR